jgi:hypothetical protein
MTLEIHVLAWDRHKYVVESKAHYPLLINQSQMAMQTIKKLHRFTSIQQPHILSQKQMTT